MDAKTGMRCIMRIGQMWEKTMLFSSFCRMERNDKETVPTFYT